MTSLSSLAWTASRAPRPNCCASRRLSRRNALDFSPLRSPGAIQRPRPAVWCSPSLLALRSSRALIATRTEEGRRAAQGGGVPFGARPNCGRINAPSLAISLKKENLSAKSPEPSMSMSQRSIAAYTTIRPYDSTPFRSHARSSPFAVCTRTRPARCVKPKTSSDSVP